MDIHSKKTTVSVIIPTFKDWPRLKLCLYALGAQTYQQNQFDVIVVNNAPGDSCPYKLPAKNMKIIEEAKPGSYAARNAGIQTAKGDVIAFTDSDCIPDKGWISGGVRCLENKNTDLAGGHVDFFFKNTSSAAELLDTIGNMNNHERIDKHKCAATANLFVKRRVFDVAGMFDASMKSGGDTEFTQRAVKNGFSLVYCSSARVKHPTRNFRAKIKKSYRVGKGLIFAELKRPGPKRQKIKMLLLHIIPIPNPIKIKRTMRRHGKKSGWLLVKMMLISSFSTLVKALGMFVSALSWPFTKTR